MVNKSIGGKIKVFPADFKVIELAGPIKEDENGPFEFLRIRSTDLEHHYLMKRISKAICVRSNEIYTYGIKDRRAITEQTICFRRNERSTLLDEIPGIEVLSRFFGFHRLRIGGHEGNSFEITVRETLIQGEELKEALDKKIEEMKEKGIPNIFGTQRFGKDGQNIAVGYLLKRGDYKGALGALIGQDLTKINFIEYKNKCLEPSKRRLLERFMEGETPRRIIRSMSGNLYKFLKNSVESKIFNERIAVRGEQFFAPYDSHGNIIASLAVPIPQEKIPGYRKKFQSKKGDFCERLGKTFRAKNLYIRNIELKEVGENFYTVSFFLNKGSYASVVMDYFAGTLDLMV